jgi:D-3-phosphoglycerate dehydrogenase
MKVLVLAPQARYDFYSADNPIRRQAELIFVDRDASVDQIITAGGDADALFVMPITRVPASLIARMPHLRMIHSEGVGVDRIDLEAAKARGIYVCNCAGCNAGAVAELTIMLMSMLLRKALWGNSMMRAGQQREALQYLEVHVGPDLFESTVGLVGFGHIAKAVAERLQPFGSTVHYFARHRATPEEERRYDVSYLPLPQLAEQCDLISLHLPASPESLHMVDAPFFARMKPTAFLINTARGALLDDEALCNAIRAGQIAGAALDCYSPEPASFDHPLVRLAREYPESVILCPHQGGIAHSAFRNAHQMIFENLRRLMDGQRPEHIVNGL